MLAAIWHPYIGAGGGIPGGALTHSPDGEVSCFSISGQAFRWGGGSAAGFGVPPDGDLGDIAPFGEVGGGTTGAGAYANQTLTCLQ